jgi:uncharacterized protein YndB with AHSA1/START domain
MAARVHTAFPHPLERVWRALTDASEFEAWFPTTIEGELVAGASLRFGFRGEPYAPFDGVMLAFEPNRLTLAGQPKAEGEEWKDLNRDYQERFGPEASTQGPPEPVRR